MAKNQKYFWWLILSLFAFVSIVSIIKYTRNNDSRHLSITERRDELIIVADFPETKSKPVQRYLIENLKMNDLSDLNHMEIKHYQTPDKQMVFYIKSRLDYVKIKFNKSENNWSAYRKMKETAEGLKSILAR